MMARRRRRIPRIQNGPGQESITNTNDGVAVGSIRATKFLIRKGPFYCTKCVQWIHDEPAPRDAQALNGVDICSRCHKGNPPKKQGKR